MKKITENDLIIFGFKSTGDKVTPYSKIITESEEGSIALVVTFQRNVFEFGLNTPDGLLFINGGLTELKVIENVVTGYSANY